MTNLNKQNESIEQNEPVINKIELTTTFFKKIYRFSEFYFGNISKSFVYITIEIESNENENDDDCNDDNGNDDNGNDDNCNDDNGNDDNGDNNSIYTNVSMDNTHSTYFQDEDLDSVTLKNTNDSHSVSSTALKNRKNNKKSKKGKKKNIIKKQEQESISNCNHDENKNPDKHSLNLNKIKNIVNNVNTEAHKKIKPIPIEKKINTIMEKITNKIHSEMIKEYMNYIFILENSKKPNGSYIHKVNAFYHVLLNKIESSL
jgi:hypothetical protein